MHKHVLQTDEGELWLWGEADALTDPRPLVLVIDGAFAIERPRTFELQSYLPEAAVLNAHLPGNHSPHPLTHSVAAYAGAYDAALDRIGKPALVVGASVGGLVALAMRSPALKGVVALDPPLVTGKLWPLIESFRTRLRSAPGDAHLRNFLWTVFGVSETKLESRDYRPLVEALARPAWALLGGEPLLPSRAITELPSLVDEPERALLAGHPQIRVRLVEGCGHNIGGRAITFVRTATRDLLTTLGLTNVEAR